ncbi:MAG: gamma-glutamylputrescine oxidase [Actinomycetota bacterium]|jgi:glycine/D-amino acid oxidase-like deaminating enzyme|nr:gamma-glutamylputrescine oxidase [Actinomycetota bacterium]
MTTVWDVDGWTGLPALQGVLEADVCVIGLGGTGLTAVTELCERGLRVVGIDAGAVAGGAAGSNGGFLLAGLAYPHHRMVALLGRERAAGLHRLTLDEMARMRRATPGAIRMTGSLRIEETAAGLADCAAQAAALRADGFAVEEYDGAEGRGLLFPDDGVLQPLSRCRTLAAAAAGAMLFENTPAVRIDKGLVTTPGGSIRCGVVLVCVDGKLDVLLPELAGVVRTVRLQMLATAPTDEVVLPRPVYLRDGYEYWQQLPDGRIAVGGFRDTGGDDEETASTETTSVVQAAIERLVRERIGVQAPITARWAASVGYTRSSLPFVGEVRPGVFAAGGYCGTGNVVGALCARALVAMALGHDSDTLAFANLSP